MKIIKLHDKTGEAKIRVDSSEDLHALSKIIQEGDLLTGKTERKIKFGGAEARQRAVRKKITLEIRVTKTISEDSVLRAQGTVTRPQEDVPINSAHTIEISPGTEFKLKKLKWFRYQIEQLKQAERNSHIPKIFLCVLDDEQANFGYLTSSGVKPAGKIRLRLAKKRIEEKKQDDIKKLAKEIISKAKDLKIIIASPLFWKELVLKSLKDINPKTAKQVLLADVSTGSKKGLYEIISTGTVDKVVKGAEISKHAQLVERLLEQIAKNKLAAYGMQEVSKAAKSSAISDLLISDKLNLKSDKILNIIKTTEKNKGRVYIISKKTDAGKKLLGLSGIAAILKFKI